jgi:hypothetical protein
MLGKTSRRSQASSPSCCPRRGDRGGGPALVVVISVDQMRSDYLGASPYFGAEGSLPSWRRRRVPAGRWQHAITFTGPAASLGTGLDPRHHIIATTVRPRGRPPSIAPRTGARHESGRPPAPRASPSSRPRRRSQHPSATAKEHYPARVVGLALRPLGGLMARRKADAVVWTRRRYARFVTSSHYPAPVIARHQRSPAALSIAPDRSSRNNSADEMERLTFIAPSTTRRASPTASPRASAPLPTARAVVSSPWGDG